MEKRPVLAILTLAALLGCGEDGAPEAFLVEGRVALGSLMALGDGRLQELAHHFQMLASTEEARSADWAQVRGPLGAAPLLQDRALLWFALPDGSYWSVQEGQAAGNLSDRGYWPRLMAGEEVLGDLVVSRATGRSAAIVAVPVLDSEGAVVGVLGSSVYLDALSLEIADEMELQQDEFFYSLDETPLVGLHKDPEVIFLYPFEEGDPELERAIQEMLESEEGVVSYAFRGRQRTVLYRRSTVSGWWYAFGVLSD